MFSLIRDFLDFRKLWLLSRLAEQEFTDKEAADIKTRSQYLEDKIHLQLRFNLAQSILSGHKSEDYVKGFRDALSSYRALVRPKGYTKQ